MQARLPVECVRVQSRLFDLFDNSLSASERERVEAHLSTCLLCAKEWESVRVAERSLRTSSYSLPSAGDLRPQFYARLQAENRTPSKRNGLRLVAWWSFGGVAMTCMGLLMFRSVVTSVPTAMTEAAPSRTARAEPKPQLKNEEVAVVSPAAPVAADRFHADSLKPLTTNRAASPPAKKVKTAARDNGEIAQAIKSSPRRTNRESTMIAKKAVDSNEALALLPKADSPQPVGVTTMTYNPENRFGATPESIRARDGIRFQSRAADGDEATADRRFRTRVRETVPVQTEEASFSIQDTERDFEAEAHIVGNTEESDGATVVTIDAGEETK